MKKILIKIFQDQYVFQLNVPLICGTTVTHVTLAMTHNAMLFDADEYDESFTKVDSKMFPYIDNIHGK
ncbi:unnamed protein product [Rotaria sp. Silwood1]|nr:unnamed protein product [Rotaria sp. Silwood1]